MSVNGVTGVGENTKYNPYIENTTQKAAETVVPATTNDTGVIYESGDKEEKVSLKTPTKVFQTNEEMISRLKLDAENRLEQLRNIVEKLISKQAGAFADANDIWSALREGKLEVDPETRAQAQKDIAEDGYWGVNQTSDRIIDFAVALTGGDESKLEKMRDAFKKGYEQAEKTWGGKLPEISQKTYDAVMEKFDKLTNTDTANQTTTN